MMDKCKTCGAIGPETPCAYPTEMVQQLQAENSRINTALLRQRQQLEDYALANIQDRQDLAAAQATIEQMRGAIGAWERAEAGQELQEAEAKLIAAMNTENNLDALHEARAQECERLAELSAFEEDEVSQFWLLGEAEQHRAKKGEGK